MQAVGSIRPNATTVFIELECLTVVWAVKTFRVYLHRKEIELETDNAALKWFPEHYSISRENRTLDRATAGT
jgi:hypothetical protein